MRKLKTRLSELDLILHNNNMASQFKFLRSSQRNSCFCAFCKSPRRLESRKHLSWINVGLSGLLAFVVMWIAWFEVNPKAIIVFVMAIVSSEIFIQIRWRLSLSCPHCQFDPILYLKSPEKAALRVREHFDSIQDSPKFAMGYHPLQKIMISKRKKFKGSRERAAAER